MPSPPIALSVRGLSKAYRLYEKPSDRLRELVTHRTRHRQATALEGVSFDLARGESLGVIGENGAGKSTLLKLITGTAQASAGTLVVEGKVAAILELGAGFHPEFSGLDNVRLNAAAMGIGERQFDERLPRILEFAELGDVVRQPVKTYSSGMIMRLAFAIATNVDADVLIIDEALSVGDGYFQKKCINRLTELRAAGGTLLFCSHAMYYVTMLCTRAVWLERGRLRAIGPALDVVTQYENHLVERERRLGPTPVLPGGGAAPQEEAERRLARITAVRVAGSGGEPRSEIASGESLHITVDFETANPGLGFHVGVGINRADEVEVFALSTARDGLAPLTGRSSYRAELVIAELPLVKGEFTLYIFVLDEKALHIYDREIIPKAFRVTSAEYEFGLIRVNHEWRI